MLVNRAGMYAFDSCVADAVESMVVWGCLYIPVYMRLFPRLFVDVYYDRRFLI